jgi:hypothetical protein
MGGGNGLKEDMSRMAWWRWILKNWLPKQSRQWKGKKSSVSMVEPQEHKKDPGAQTTSENAGGVKGAFEGT